jgi:cytochrome c-type biogenesis protein CcmH/NrfG
VRRYSTAIVIVVAAVLATVIVVASSTGHDLDGARPDDTASTLPPDHRIAQADPDLGIIDTAAAERSIAALERARWANPGSLRVILNLGDTYLAVYRYDDAEAAYRDALAAGPAHPNATVGLAMVAHARGDDARAVRLLQRVLKAYPDHQQAQYDLALVRFSRREVAAARKAWVKAAQIDPTSSLGRASQDFVDLLSGGDAAP